MRPGAEENAGDRVIHVARISTGRPSELRVLTEMARGQFGTGAEAPPLITLPVPAILDTDHEAQIQVDEIVTNPATGTMYTGYSGDLIDLAQRRMFALML